ncbi:MAG TPA: hypothetical protein VHX86_12325 [Tepidisphaeraceae bacterium]|jgi:signal transduction histidine kinase|nr:hypothetical protein [Tepidisphaeraceae bacterium]
MIHFNPSTIFPDRVLTMLTTLMDISEAEAGLMKLEPAAFSLADLIAAVIEL